MAGTAGQPTDSAPISGATYMSALPDRALPPAVRVPVVTQAEVELKVALWQYFAGLRQRLVGQLPADGTKQV